MEVKHGARTVPKYSRAFPARVITYRRLFGRSGPNRLGRGIDAESAEGGGRALVQAHYPAEARSNWEVEDQQI